MLSTWSEQQGKNIRVRTVFLTLTKILDLLVYFHQVCKKMFFICIMILRLLDRHAGANSADPDHSIPSFLNGKISCLNFDVIKVNIFGVQKFKTFMVSSYIFMHTDFKIFGPFLKLFLFPLTRPTLK